LWEKEKEKQFIFSILSNTESDHGFFILISTITSMIEFLFKKNNSEGTDFMMFARYNINENNLINPLKYFF
jgi:hypothetical protein